MTFSVLITCYNYRDFVLEAVDSALAQSPAPLEVIVVDDGSIDGSCERLRERHGAHPAVKIIRTENRGQLAGGPLRRNGRRARVSASHIGTWGYPFNRSPV